MASLFRRAYATIDPRTGCKVRKKTRKWYGKFADENGAVQRVPLSANKTAAQQMLRRLVEQVERKKAGLFHPAEEHAKRPLVEHLDDYAAEKRAQNIPDAQVRQTVNRIRAILTACRVTFAGDIQAAAVLEYLAELRRDRPRPELPEQEWFSPAELAKLLGVGRQAITVAVRRHGWRGTAKGRGPARRYPRSVAVELLELQFRGLGSQTVSYYWREFGAFCRWLASPRQKRMLENPLADVPGPEPRSDPRHDRRALSLEELYKLLETARSSSWTWRDLSGLDRYFLYLTACGTGFRRKELSALTPTSFDLDGDFATASLPGRRTKNKKAATQPLPPDLAVALRDYLSGRPADAPIWERKQLKGIAEAMRHDLAAVGIPYVTDGPEGPLFADFHCLRHSYVLLLDQAGVSVKQAMNLARHSDPRLTMARYGRPHLGDLASAVNRLPALTARPPDEKLQALRATGTDSPGASSLCPPLAPLCPKLAPTGDSGRKPVRAVDNPTLAERVSPSRCDDNRLSSSEDGSERLRVVGMEHEMRKTPSDRRRASSIGEELVPK